MYPSPRHLFQLARSASRSLEAGLLRQGAVACISGPQSLNYTEEPQSVKELHSCALSTALSLKQASLLPQRYRAWENTKSHREAYSTTSKPGLNKEGLFEIPLAQTGEGIAECEVLKWNVQEGQEVQQFDLLCEVQSDKASVEITSRYTGTIRKIHFQPGDIVKVGEILCDLTPTGSQSNAATSSEEPALLAAHRATATPGDIAFETPASPKPTEGSRHKTSASPAVRALAREYGIDLSQVVGTGPDGRVLKGDVLKYVAVSQGVEETREAGGNSDTPDSLPAPKTVNDKEPDSVPEIGSQASQREPVDARKGDRVVPLRGYRRAMAKTMAAVNEVPHFTFCEEIEMDRLVELRARLQASEKTDVRITYMPIMMKALSTALRDFPEINATVNSDATELTCRASHNIGVAMATPKGLVVPNVKNCQDLTVKEIASEMQRLQGLSKSGSLTDQDLKGGTITVSNVGTIGGTYATPLVNLPEVAIVALGKVRTLPRYKNGQLQPVAIMQVSWSADHRVIDGASIAAFCQAWKRYIESPDFLLVHLR